MTGSQLDALRAAVCASPDEDAPRLVYADYVAEHGDAARAELIRVQCELATLDATHRRRAGLLWREWELLARHAPRWRAELPTLRGLQWGRFTRGFVSEVWVDD